MIGRRPLVSQEMRIEHGLSTKCSGAATVRRRKSDTMKNIAAGADVTGSIVAGDARRPLPVVIPFLPASFPLAVFLELIKPIAYIAPALDVAAGCSAHRKVAAKPVMGTSVERWYVTVHMNADSAKAAS